MKLKTLIRRSLRFHLRSHMGVLCGVIIGSAALTGALVVGDSVRETLKENALSRLGPAAFAIFSGDRLFQTSLRQRICDGHSGGLGSKPAGPQAWPRGSVCPLAYALMLPGVVARQDGSARANQVTVLGVEDPAWASMADWDAATLSDWRSGESAFINQALARQLNARKGDEIILRIRKPSALGLDASIAPKSGTTVSMRLRIAAVLSKEMLGDFALSPGQAPQPNLFLPYELLRKQLDLDARANVMLVGEIGNIRQRRLTWWDKQRVKIASLLWRIAPRRQVATRGGPRTQPDPGSVPARAAARMMGNARTDRVDPISTRQEEQVLSRCLEESWSLGDGEIFVRAIEQPQSATGGEYIQPSVDVGAERIFLDDSIVAAALRPRTNLLADHPAFATDSEADLQASHFVTNGIRILTYLANLIQAGSRSTPYSMITAAESPFVPPEMRDNEILVNEWLAEDLAIKPGDSVQLSYYVVDSGSKLLERTNTFRVRAILPLKGIYAERTLMPEFPGIAKAESTHDWDAGFPLTYTIREKDEAYWKKYRGTPKAFITLAAGQALWANRFGKLTAVRYRVPANTFASSCRDIVYRNLLANLQPSDVGLSFEPVRERALQAANQSQDFGGLFVGFSFFLVLAALLLMALLFQFGLEQRVVEIGTLLSLGFTPRRVRKLFLREGVALANFGGLVGAFAGIGYAWLMLWGLNTVWNRAIANSRLEFHAAPQTIAAGLISSVIIATLVIWFALRKQARQPARELLAGNTGQLTIKSRGYVKWMVVAVLSIGSAIATLIWAFASGERADAEAFFSIGCLLLMGGIAGIASWLGWLGKANDSSSALSISKLGLRSCVRRRSRSLATVALMASGCFVICSMGVFRLDATRDAAAKTSGTGGFALLGQSTIPIVKDLNTASGQEFFGLDPKELSSVHFIPFRVKPGEDASCLNLNRAQKPRLLGVRPELLAGHFTFSAAAKGWDAKAGWKMLESRSSPEVIPAIGDAASIEWALGKKLGDTIDYTDENGRRFKIMLVGALANSVLQGSLIIDEAEFVRRFPSESGYRMFLIDAPSNDEAQVAAMLSRSLEDFGLELTPTVRKLEEFNAVQNTYLNTFQILGGIGLLLGSAGLGIVVLRNVTERRGELAVLLAVGFRPMQVRKLLLGEHGTLLVFGIAVGLIAAAVAVLPQLLAPDAHLPWTSLGITLAALLLNGFLWTWLATKHALRGNLLAALRNE